MGYTVFAIVLAADMAAYLMPILGTLFIGPEGIQVRRGAAIRSIPAGQSSPCSRKLILHGFKPRSPVLQLFWQGEDCPGPDGCGARRTRCLPGPVRHKVSGHDRSKDDSEDRVAHQISNYAKTTPGGMAEGDDGKQTPGRLRTSPQSESKTVKRRSHMSGATTKTPSQPHMERICNRGKRDSGSGVLIREHSDLVGEDISKKMFAYVSR